MFISKRGRERPRRIPLDSLNSHGTAAVRIAEGLLKGGITRNVSVLSNEEMGCLAFRLHFETGQFHL